VVESNKRFLFFLFFVSCLFIYLFIYLFLGGAGGVLLFFGGGNASFLVLGLWET